MDTMYECQASCRLCYGPLERKLEGTVGDHLAWKVCKFCGTQYGPPWPEHQWEDPSSEPAPSYIVCNPPVMMKQVAER